MPNYLANYKVPGKISGINLLHRVFSQRTVRSPEITLYKEFSAENEIEAIRLADEYERKISSEADKRKVRLEDLFEVRRVYLPRDDIPF